MSHWFTEQEQAVLDAHLPHYFGHELLVLGEVNASCAKASLVSHHSAVSPAVLLGTEGVVADWFALPFAAESMDVVLVRHATEYVAKLPAFLEEIKRVLRHDGYVLFCQFNAWHPQAHQVQKQVCRPLITEPRHVYAPGHLKSILRENGLDIVRVHRYGRQVAMRHQAGLPSKLQHLAYQVFPRLSLGYLMVAQKRGHCLTPIQPRKFWKNVVFSRKVMTRAR